MKYKLPYPVLPFLALPLLALSATAQTTGVSHPDPSAESVEVAPAQADHYVKPSPSAAYSEQSYPATGPATSYPGTGPAPATAGSPVATGQSALIIRRPDPAASYVPAQEASIRPRPVRDAKDDDSGIISEVPVHPHELGEGTVLKIRLDQTLSTANTYAGAAFSAQLLSDVGHSGEVLLPAGSIVRGRVASVHSGSRLTGGASMRLQPQSVTLPDGSNYSLLASVSDVDSPDNLHVNDEGLIQPKSNARVAASAVGLSTTAGAVTGAVVGGGVGAVVGAGIGAGVGAAVLLKQDHQETLPAGTSLYLSLDEPLQLNPR